MLISCWYPQPACFTTGKGGGETMAEQGFEDLQLSQNLPFSQDSFKELWDQLPWVKSSFQIPLILLLFFLNAIITPTVWLNLCLSVWTLSQLWTAVQQVTMKPGGQMAPWTCFRCDYPTFCRIASLKICRDSCDFNMHVYSWKQTDFPLSVFSWSMSSN